MGSNHYSIESGQATVVREKVKRLIFKERCILTFFTSTQGGYFFCFVLIFNFICVFVCWLVCLLQDSQFKIIFFIKDVTTSYVPYLPEYKSHPSISRTLYFCGENFDFNF